MLAATFAAFYGAPAAGNLALEVMSEDYIRTARAKGACPPARRAAPRVARAATPIVTVLGLDIGIPLGGAILTESVSSTSPESGATPTHAIKHSDLPAIQGTVLFGAFFIIVANLVGTSPMRSWILGCYR